jgi:Transposase DDE domain
MLDLDTFLTTLYVLVDDSIKSQPAKPPRPGPQPHLTDSEVATLALMAQWKQFVSERAFVRYAVRHLRQAFPSLPHRAQLNRLIRDAHGQIVGVGQALVTLLGSAEQPYEVLDGMGVAVRNNRRIGPGWLDGIATTGWSNRLGWYDGFHVLTAVDRIGVVTGYAVAPASTKDQPYAEDFLAARAHPYERLPMVGQKASGVYLADRGFEGRERHRRWFEEYGAQVLAPPRNDRKHAWPRDWCKWHARKRQIVETVHGKWTESFRLDDERPHTLEGFLARFAALAALHNACIWINRSLGREPLAFADLVDW